MANKYEELDFHYQRGSLCRREFVRWFFLNVVNRCLTKEQAMMRRVLWSHFKSDGEHDMSFGLVDELNLMVWRNLYKRGLDISEDEIIEKTKRLGLRVRKVAPSAEDAAREWVSERAFRDWVDRTFGTKRG